MNLLLRRKYIGKCWRRKGDQKMEYKLGCGGERALARREGPKTSLTNFKHHSGSACWLRYLFFSQDIKQLEIGP